MSKFLDKSKRELKVGDMCYFNRTKDEFSLALILEIKDDKVTFIRFDRFTSLEYAFTNLVAGTSTQGFKFSKTKDYSFAPVIEGRQVGFLIDNIDNNKPVVCLSPESYGYNDASINQLDKLVKKHYGELMP